MIDNEFTKIDDNNITSKNGFSVQCGLPYWIGHLDRRGESRISAELLAQSKSGNWGVLLYMNSPFSTYPEGTDEAYKLEMLENITRALRHLGREAQRSQMDLLP